MSFVSQLFTYNTENAFYKYKLTVVEQAEEVFHDLGRIFGMGAPKYQVGLDWNIDYVEAAKEAGLEIPG